MFPVIRIISPFQLPWPSKCHVNSIKKDHVFNEWSLVRTPSYTIFVRTCKWATWRTNYDHWTNEWLLPKCLSEIILLSVLKISSTKMLDDEISHELFLILSIISWIIFLGFDQLFVVWELKDRRNMNDRNRNTVPILRSIFEISITRRSLKRKSVSMNEQTKCSFTYPSNWTKRESNRNNHYGWHC